MTNYEVNVIKAAIDYPAEIENVEDIILTISAVRKYLKYDLSGVEKKVKKFQTWPEKQVEAVVRSVRYCCARGWI